MKIIILCIAILLLFYFAYKSRPAGNKFGTDINKPHTWLNDSKTRFKVGTYNVQSGKDENGKRNILRSAEVIKQADIVGIQEVYAKPWLGKKGQTQQLAEYADFGWLFAATRRRWFREHRGNALLSKFPVSHWKIEHLPDQTGKQFRNLTTAIIPFQGTEITVLVTHLHTKKGREKQLEKVLTEFSQHEHAILMGDFNTPTDNHQLQALLQQNSYQDAVLIALPNIVHTNKIDWIIVKGLQIHSGNYLPIGVSDHPYFEVELSL